MWTEGFLNEMTALRDALAPVAEGLPTVRSLVIRRRGRDKDTFLEIEPKPLITYTSPQERSLEGMSQIQTANQQFQVQGVSRKYSYEDLVGQRLDYWIDGIVKDQELIQGIECSLVSIEEQSTVWNLTLESRIGEQQVYAY
jgi:hypothetical protein